MNCEQSRERLLDADPDELRARRGELGEHLRACEACARVANALLAQDAALDHALRTLATTPRRQRRWPRAAALVPLAAAAALALLLGRNPGSYPPIVLPEPEVPTSTVVNSTGSGGVAVMQTRDPNITVVWNF